jgi:hypothetical protein
MTKKKRRTAKLKTEIVLKHLKGEPLEILCREYKVSASEITKWKTRFMSAGSVSLKSTVTSVDHKELERAKRLLGEQAMEIEILKKRNHLIQRIKNKS